MKKVEFKKIITICSSASFYKECLEVERKLKKLGFRVKVPKTARVMLKRNDFNVHKPWLKNKKFYTKKRQLMIDHFKKVMQANAVFVVNLKKHDMDGYIGGNVLIEMAIAFHYQKPIFIYRDIDKKHPLAEEIYGFNPVFIKEDLSIVQRRLR